MPPELLPDKPFVDLSPLEAFYCDGFNALQSERPQGMGIAFIPWSKIYQYAEAEGLCDIEKDIFVRVVHRVDVHVVNTLAEKRKNARNKKLR